jgi:rubrerythrin
MRWEALEAIKTAIQNEKEGLSTYLDFAMKTDSKEGKDMYISLARDEHSHVQRLHKKLNQMLKELMSGHSFDPADTEHIFSLEGVIEGEVKERPELPDQETAVLEMAIENERAAQVFYTQQAQKSDDPLLKSLYDGLAKEEERHEMLLRAELDSVKGLGHWFDFREFTLEAPG